MSRQDSTQQTKKPAAETSSDGDGEGLDSVALTGRLTAALRARESTRDDRLFTDPLAVRLAGAQGQRLLEHFGENSTIAVRTRFFDDALVAASDGLDQIVVLAAGMDTRAFRLDLPAGVTMFELDKADVLTLKQRLLTRSPDDVARARCPRRAVGVDLAGDWVTPLLEAGFRAERPTCWLVEGLAQYLRESEVRLLLDRLTGLSAEGSQLLMDFVGQSLLDSPVMRPMLDRFARHDAPWRYGTDRPEEPLSVRGWIPDVTLISTIGTQLGRWPYPEVPRDTPGVGQGYFVRARR